MNRKTIGIGNSMRKNAELALFLLFALPLYGFSETPQPLPVQQGQGDLSPRAERIIRDAERKERNEKYQGAEECYFALLSNHPSSFTVGTAEKYLGILESLDQQTKRRRWITLSRSS